MIYPHSAHYAPLNMLLVLLSIVSSKILFADEILNSKIAPSEAFLKYWKSGLAEISSYDITEERYGEMRKAQGVLIFVYEEVNLDTRIKVESDKTPLDRQIPVLKLNNVLKFTTGIYDYSILTSVFAGLSGHGIERHFQPQKISFSSQEWCGHVYQQIIPRKSGLVSEMHSYFEAEGDAKSTIPYPVGNVYYEDELPILLRELDGEFLEIGSTLKLQLVPSLWERRKRHENLAFSPATLIKDQDQTFSFQGKPTATIKWTLENHGTVTTFHIETEIPHKLLAWENSRGENATLLKSVRKPYWGKHENKHQTLRKELGLNYGVGSGQ
jgi:hypothetical protein